MQGRERYFEGRMDSNPQTTKPVRQIQTSNPLTLKVLHLEIRSIFSISRGKIKSRILGYSAYTCGSTYKRIPTPFI